MAEALGKRNWLNIRGLLARMSDVEGGSLSQYALLAGRTSGQTLIGGRASGEPLKLQSTSHATKWKVLFGASGNSAYNEALERWGFGTNNPQRNVQIHGAAPILRFSDSNASTDTEVEALIEFYRGLTTNRVGWLGFGSAVSANFLINNSVAGGDVRIRTQDTDRLTIDHQGRIGIGTTAPGTYSQLQIDSTTRAFLPPRMTTTQRNAMVPVNGMIIYNSTTATHQGYQGGAWANL